MEKQEDGAKKYGYKVTEDSPFFIRRTREPLLPGGVTHGFKKIVTKLGSDDVRFYDLRYTHAIVMLLQGFIPGWCRKDLGHSKMSTTMDVYSHIVPDVQKDAVKRFAMALEVGV